MIMWLDADEETVFEVSEAFYKGFLRPGNLKKRFLF